MNDVNELPNSGYERRFERRKLMWKADTRSPLDFFCRLAAQICEAPLAFLFSTSDGGVSLLSSHGAEGSDLAGYVNFSISVFDAAEGSTMVVTDLKEDLSFHRNPQIEPPLGLRFFASCVFSNDMEEARCFICVLDNFPKTLTAYQLQSLNSLGGPVLEFLRLDKRVGELESNEKRLVNTLKVYQEGQRINKLGVWELDIATGKTIWTEEVYAIHEVPVGFDHNQSNGVDFYHPEDRETIREAVMSCIEHQRPFDVSCRLITATGREKWVRATGKRINGTLLGAFQDITDIKRQEWKFKGIFDSSLSFIGFLNLEGVLLEANETALREAGIRREDVVGKFFWDCYWWQISVAAREELKHNFKRACKGEEVTYEVSVWTRNETPVTILFSLKPVRDEFGNVIYIIPEGRPIQEIVATRNRYRALIESTLAGTFEWDVSSGSIVVNDQYAYLLGYEPRELDSFSVRDWEDFTDRVHKKRVKALLISCFKKERAYFQLEVPARQKSGHFIWVNVRGKVIEWSEDGRALKMYGTLQDISDRKEREEEARYQQNILHALYELSPIGISLVDYYTGEFVDVNRKLLEPTGYTKEEFLRLTNAEITPVAYEQLEQQAVQDMKLRGYYGPYEKEHIRKDGSRYPVRLQGVVIKDLKRRKLIWSFTEDISSKKETESQLSVALANLRAVLDAGTQVSIIATDLDGVITHFNTGAEEMLGYSGQEMIGKNTPSLIHLEEDIFSEAAKIQEEFGEIVSGFDVLVYRARKGMAYTREWNYLRADGTPFPVLLSVTAIRQGGYTTGFLGIAVDISRLKEAERKVSELHELTKQQNDRLRNFAFIVSHNLRSHSGGISGLVDLLKTANPDYFENEVVSMIELGANNLRQTIQDLTEVIKVNLDNEARVNLAIRPLIQRNVESLSAMIRKENIRVENLVPERLKIRAIPAYMESITLNFITNAIKYKATDRDSYLRIDATEDGGQVIMSFEDNGMGIDLEKHGKVLFGLYKTFHRHQDSRGVGLFIAKNQIETMGGHIEVSSEVGFGTTFKVYLPVESA
ncbi:hypothetical protein ADIS_2155 [Lunatimonas lonarensis]|uniref:histidine kinase n=1 Tax=Lunatimonas lonarensis TaxID=1232681 RepID=R7ZT73_9BACT|nr:PAS domain S-box protein [Lunatimonas lonarensis]EON77287.1 hypothetical protein ADIS_2155 [Lunatimonas lonarensis]